MASYLANRETLAIIGKASQGSASTVRRVKFIKAHGSPTLQEAVRNGEISTWKAYSFLKGQGHIH